MKYFKCKLHYIFTLNCSLVNCVVFLTIFFSKIVGAQQNTITKDLFNHLTLSSDALYSSFYFSCCIIRVILHLPSSSSTAIFDGRGEISRTTDKFR